ncbi:MAG: TRAP transporter large permease [Planctomycetaceae bacterium]|nr:TRAP transporter large permease [Planctomycetaceae bacterium]
MTTTVIIVVFVVLAVLGMNVALALGCGTLIGIVFFSTFNPIVVAQRMVTGIDSYTLLAIPLFMLAGRLMNDAGVTDRLFDLCKALVGHIRGALAYVNVLASMVFATMSGSAVADVGGLGQVEIKAMKDQGYAEEFAAAITLASSAVGPIIPPSINFVIYAALANVSPGKLFLAGILPGMLMGLSLIGLVFVMGFFIPYPIVRDHTSLGEKLRVFRRALLSLFTPVLILGGIMGGIFTPTEASSVAVVYVLFLGVVVYRTIRLRDLPAILLDTIASTAIVTFIISCSAAFSWVMVVGNVAQDLQALILALIDSKVGVLLVLNVILLVLGCFMENGTLLILLTPILMPLASRFQIDPIQFGVILVLNLMIGVVTPPVGTALFVVSDMTGLSIGKLAKPVLTFVLPLIVVLALVTYWPSVSLTIPNYFSR